MHHGRAHVGGSVSWANQRQLRQALERASLGFEIERLFLELVRRARLPPPVCNGLLAGHRVDFHWPAYKLAVETDGRAAHAHALAFESDRQHDLELELAGWHVLRLTWRQVTRQPGRVAAMLRRRLATS